MKTLADITVDLIHSEGLGCLGKSLFTGSISEEITCDCGCCDFCIKGCLVYVEQGEFSFPQCTSTIRSEVTISCRGELNTSQEIPFQKLINIRNALKRARGTEDYRVRFEFLDSGDRFIDNSGRHVFFMKLRAFYNKK